MCEILEFTLGT